ncbi:hypothetical protein CEXT_151301 [Caerostris extrusa]|uniref:Uncharacterized protein n=1 Tax=Caerostris extrusa TaxID=172846 RepID=A0AAV4SBW5_CAEEX|nr:hypothetical protein CEXT_151301 [Caerostris extrusa]
MDMTSIVLQYHGDDVLSIAARIVCLDGKTPTAGVSSCSCSCSDELCNHSTIEPEEELEKLEEESMLDFSCVHKSSDHKYEKRHKFDGRTKEIYLLRVLCIQRSLSRNELLHTARPIAPKGPLGTLWGPIRRWKDTEFIPLRGPFLEDKYVCSDAVENDDDVVDVYVD